MILLTDSIDSRISITLTRPDLWHSSGLGFGGKLQSKRMDSDPIGKMLCFPECHANML